MDKEKDLTKMTFAEYQASIKELIEFQEEKKRRKKEKQTKRYLFLKSCWLGLKKIVKGFLYLVWFVIRACLETPFIFF